MLGRSPETAPVLALTVVAALCAPAGLAQGDVGSATSAAAAAGPAVLNGYRRYNSACNHCHGPDGIGSTFAPSLIEQPLPLAPFEEIVRNGIARGMSVMRGFADDPNVAPYIEDIHAYLAARAAGVIGRGRPAAGR